MMPAVCLRSRDVVNGSLDYETTTSHEITRDLPQALMAVLHRRASRISVTDDPDEHDVSAISDIMVDGFRRTHR